MRITNKKIGIILMLVTIELIGIVIYMWPKSEALDDVKLNSINNELFAIMLEQADGTYKEEGDSWPSGDYVYNETKSGCIDINGNDLKGVLSFDSVNNIATVDTGSTGYCYLYFDIVSEENYCIDRGITNLRECLLVSENKSYDAEEAIAYIINKGEGSGTNDLGLYKTIDEDGNTYYYRGAVDNNYVSYGGFIWRIVRVNGSGSIRMIYSGTSTSATGSDVTIGKGVYNLTSDYKDLRFVGYKYGEDLVQRETENLITTNRFDTVKEICYSKGYHATSDGLFQLDFSSGNYICTTLESDYENIIKNYPYSCKESAKDFKCTVIYHIKEYVGTNTVKTYYISNNSKDYASTLTNEIDSAIKVKVDTWYENNILNKTDINGFLLSNYLTDEVFCNDRSLHSGTGYLLDSNTYYKGHNRVQNKNLSLLCTQDSDKFSVESGFLKYPIALITADEIMYAGSIFKGTNKTYYLYTGETFWAMTPGYFLYNYLYNYISVAKDSGGLDFVSMTSSNGIRPVINLNSNIKITNGNGTATYPYEITIE